MGFGGMSASEPVPLRPGTLLFAVPTVAYTFRVIRSQEALASIALALPVDWITPIMRGFLLLVEVRELFALPVGV